MEKVIVENGMKTIYVRKDEKQCGSVFDAKQCKGCEFFNRCKKK